MRQSYTTMVTNPKSIKFGKRTLFISGWLQLAFFCFIIAFGVLYFLFIYNLLTPLQQNWYAALSVAYFIPPAGKETVILVGLSQGLPVLHWCSTLWVFDILVCLGIITNWWFLELFINHIPPFPFLGIRREKPHLYRTMVSLKLWYEKLQKKTNLLCIQVLVYVSFHTFKTVGKFQTKPSFFATKASLNMWHSFV